MIKRFWALRFSLSLAPWALSKHGIGVTLLLSSLALTNASLAADIQGSEDHPLVSRYEGSEIFKYSDEEFNEYPLFISDISTNKGIEGQPESVKMLEGRVTKILYINPAERTPLEVFRNYEIALKNAGFETIYSCAKKECGSYHFRKAMGGYIWFTSDSQRYMAAKLSRDDGDYYVALYVTPSGTGGGPDFKRTLTQLNIIKVESMQEDMVTVDADAMFKGIGEDGRVALYGILFDVNKATIKPGSEETLANIATLMKDNPEMKLVIVGHTDNQGDLEYNMDLSSRRAKAVKAALVNDYDASDDRLSAWGVGYLSPVTTNRNEAGRAENRRVELVEE